MKKRIIALLMTLALGLAITGPVYGAESGFADVPAGAGYAEAVAWCRERGLMNGVSATEFAPDGTLTRAMVAAVLYRAEGEPAVNGEPAFADTRAGVWYSDAVAWANENQVMEGYGNGLFGTEDPITREQLATILWRYAGEQVLEQAQLSDRDAVSGFALAAVDWAVGSGVMSYRMGAGFGPKENATRAETAQAFYAYLASPEEPSAERGRVLVAYFSATGSTGAVAETIAETLDGDLFELVPMEPYSSADLNYSNASSRVSREHDDPGLRDVALAVTTPDNWEEYDVIFVGYPIWWGIAAWPVNRFVTENDFSGKTVIPFCTSASSGLGESGELLEAMAGGGAWQTGRRFSSGAPQSTIKSWLEGLNLHIDSVE